MNIESKQISESVTTIKTFTVDKLDEMHITTDNPFLKTLCVQLNEAIPSQLIAITGAEYDALGQWTDESLTAYIKSKYGLVQKVVIEESKEL